MSAFRSRREMNAAIREFVEQHPPDPATDPNVPSTAPQPAPLDLDAIEARVDAATPGPWERGEVWQWAGVMPDRFGPGRCALCGSSGEPVWAGTAGINGRQMQAHKHRNPDPYQPDHLISGPDGVVTGNFDYEEGGIVSPVDAEFIAAARQDVPALVAEVRRLRAELDAAPAAPCCTQRAGYECDVHPGPLSPVPPAGTEGDR